MSSLADLVARLKSRKQEVSKCDEYGLIKPEFYKKTKMVMPGMLKGIVGKKSLPIYSAEYAVWRYILDNNLDSNKLVRADKKLSRAMGKRIFPLSAVGRMVDKAVG